MGGIGKDKALHGHGLDVCPGDVGGETHLPLAVFAQEGTNHRQVGIRTHAALVVGHGMLALETAAGLTNAVGGCTVLEIVLHIGGKVGQHLKEVGLHGCLGDKIAEHGTTSRHGSR